MVKKRAFFSENEQGFLKEVKCVNLKSPEIWKILQAKWDIYRGKVRETKFPQYNKMKFEKIFLILKKNKNNKK